MRAFHERMRQLLPKLTADNYQLTSAVTWEYNCIAWAMGETDRWWWPAPGRYWPPDVPMEETLLAFFAAFATAGFRPCEDGRLEPELEKVAVYARGDVPTHAARQLPNGAWTSKLGPSVDIEHTSAEAVAGGEYSEIVAFLARPRPE